MARFSCGQSGLMRRQQNNSFLRGVRQWKSELHRKTSLFPNYIHLPVQLFNVEFGKIATLMTTPCLKAGTYTAVNSRRIKAPSMRFETYGRLLSATFLTRS